MRHSKSILTIITIFGFIVAGYTESAVERGTTLMKRNDDRPVFQKVKGDVTINIYNSSGSMRFKKKLIMAAYTENMGTANEVEHYISYFKEPADDKGNSYLAHNFKNKSDVKIVYLKGIRKAKKVTGADKSLSFFGSDFNNGDMGKPDYYEWNYKLLGEEKVVFKGKTFTCYAIECIPKTDAIKRELGYGRKVTYLEKDTLLSLKLEYYDLDLTKLKEMRLLSFLVKKNSKGQKVYYETGLELKNVKTGTKTELLFSNLNFEEDANIRTDIFTIQYLTRKWW